MVISGSPLKRVLWRWHLMLWAALLAGCQSFTYTGQAVALPRGENLGVINSMHIRVVGVRGRALSEYTDKDITVATYDAAHRRLGNATLRIMGGPVQFTSEWHGAERVDLVAYDSAPKTGAPRLGVWRIHLDPATGKILQTEWIQEEK